MQELALDAVRSVTIDIPGSAREIDVKKYAKVCALFIQLEKKTAFGLLCMQYMLACPLQPCLAPKCQSDLIGI